MIFKVSSSSKFLYLCLSGYQNHKFYLKTTLSLSFSLSGKEKTNQQKTEKFRDSEKWPKLASSTTPADSNQKMLIPQYFKCEKIILKKKT